MVECTHDLGDGILVLLSQTDSLLYCNFIEGVHAELDVLVDAFAVRGNTDLDGCNDNGASKFLPFGCKLRQHGCQYCYSFSSLCRLPELSPMLTIIDGSLDRNEDTKLVD